MKKIFNYLFPSDWIDVEVIDLKQYSQYSGEFECKSKRLIIQKSYSTGRYRKIVLNLNPL